MEPNGPQKRKGEFTLENFAGAFCVLAAGLVIASIVAVVEIWTFIKGGNIYPPVSHRVENDTKGSTSNLAKADMFIFRAQIIKHIAFVGCQIKNISPSK